MPLLFVYGELERSDDNEDLCCAMGELRLRTTGADTADLPDAAANFQKTTGIVWGQLQTVTYTELAKLDQKEAPEYGRVALTVMLPDRSTVKAFAYQYLNTLEFRGMPRIASGDFQKYMRGKK